MDRRTLNDERWTCRLLRAADDAPSGFPTAPIPASVPGCIHTDLIHAGLIGHPNVGNNEATTQWVSRCDWQYRCEFQVDTGMLEHDRIDVVFDSLDTIASITLNGIAVSHAANQFQPQRFDIGKTLRLGQNELLIDFKSPLNHIHTEAKRLGPRPVNGDWDPYVFIRKSACNFGWDWGPKVATCGVIHGVDIEGWNTARITEVRPLIFREAGGTWRVETHVGIEATVERRAKPLILIATIRDGEQVISTGEACVTGGGNTCITLTASDVTSWMPRGHGEARLYALKVELHDPLKSAIPPRTALSLAHRRIGFRTITLDTAPDNDGCRFKIRVNDKPIFVLGANWIPEGLFPEDRWLWRIRQRVRQATDANLNLLRVWGGGAYECDAFYDACDELGILVWQDFMFACACYPEEEPIRSQVESEARYQIARLSSHPSVALWCGGNECIWAWQVWGFANKLKPGQTWGRGYWLDLLPRLCKELDPTRPYWPNTPWSGDLTRDVQDPNHGTRHTWDRSVEGYREIVPRFIAEFGHQSPPTYATIRESLGSNASESITPSQIESHLARRQRATGGDAGRYTEPLAEHFAPAQNFDEWLYQTHLLQARAIALGIEWARIHRDRCGGAVFWQWNDAWAGHSWSAVDSGGRLKPLWYAVRRMCAPNLITIQPIDGHPRLFAVNDSPDAKSETLHTKRVRFDGTVLASADAHLSIDPDRSMQLLDLTDALGPPADPARECLVVNGQDHRAFWFFKPDRDLIYEPPHLAASLRQESNALHITITAETLLRDLVLAADRVLPDALVNEQLVTLLPGESATFVVTSEAAATLEQATLRDALLSPSVIRCASGDPLIRPI